MMKLKKNPNYIKELARHKYDRDKAKESVAAEVEQMLDQDLHISTVSWLKNHLKESQGIEVKEWVLREIM